jgi:hypothetical protein
MRYLVVKNYAKLVHQDGLPWIKLSTGILEATRAPQFAELPDATKCLLYHLWLMAKVFNGRIPEDWLTREKLNLKSRISLDQIIDSGYAWFEDENRVRLQRGLDSTLDSRAINKAFDFDSKNLEPLREEDSKPKSKAKSKSLVESFVLLPKHREWAAKNTPSVPIETELEAWRDRCRNNGYKSGKAPGIPIQDAQASFYTAMRNAEAWGTYTKGGRTPPPSGALKIHKAKPL